MAYLYTPGLEAFTCLRAGEPGRLEIDPCFQRLRTLAYVVNRPRGFLTPHAI